MKKLFLALSVCLLAAVCLLCACGTQETAVSSSDAPSSEEPSAQTSSSAESIIEITSSADGSAQEIPRPEDAVKVLYTRYTEKPTFVMIGTCAQGATVTAEIDGETVSIPSYMGWFALSFTKSGSRFDVTFTQTVDGVQYDIARTFSVRPTSPEPSNCYAIASTETFQFFLSKMLPDHMGQGLYPDSAVRSMQSRVSERLDRLQSYNQSAEIIYLVVPSPMTIYPELVPEQYTQGNGTSRYDQIKAALTESGATVIDVRELFTEHKNDEMPLYYKLDSHWADYGAYLAYTALFDRISESFPDAAPRGIDEFTWTADYYTSADAMLYLSITQADIKEYGYYREFIADIPSQITAVPRYRGMQLIYSEETTEQKVFRTNRENLPSCVVFRDSYCAGIYDLIPERMNDTYYVGMWNYAWNETVMSSEKPDYVIYLVAEWNLNEIVYN